MDMHCGWVSDEMDTALAGVEFEFHRDGEVRTARSGVSGAVDCELDDGNYDVLLGAPGFGRKWSRTTIRSGEPVRWRLLSTRPYGYAWPKWVRSGEQSQLRIHAPAGCTVDLYRYGWEREHTAHIGRFTDHPPGAMSQILPDGDIAASGVRWGEHGYAQPPTDPRCLVTAPQASGLYYFHLEDGDGRFFSFPWVVAPSHAQHQIAVLTSNLTWNAYNDFGGRSNYVSPSALRDRPVVNARQDSSWFTDPAEPAWHDPSYDPLSFDRPEPLNRTTREELITDPIAELGAEHVAPAEWRLLGWLEREGFAVDVHAEPHLDAGQLDLTDYRVAIISTHPEYWTRRMYERLKTWVVEDGGKLLYLGGNGINCEVEFVEHDAMVVRNGSDGSRGPGSESRFAASVEPEASLLGVTTTLTGYETGAPYRVLDAEHWAFSGTGLRDGDEFGHRSLDMRARGGASGHETDKRSESTPVQARLLAKGTNRDDGGGEMVHIQYDGGGEVFSVGSISYTCAIAVDEQISRITSTVLQRFLER